MTLQSVRGLSKLETAIAGFDALSDGGLPVGRVTLLVGGPGTGKTIFALQTLSNAAARGQRSLYVSFEEAPSEIMAVARTFEWGTHDSLPRMMRLVDGGEVADTFASGAADLSAVLRALEAQLRASRASWIVFDGLDALLALLSDPLAERREIHRLRRWLSKLGIGCLITAKEADEGKLVDIGQVDGLLAFAADCVIRLSAQVCDRVIDRFLRIVKYRGTAVGGGEVPIIFRRRGIVVGYQGTPARRMPSRQRVSTGVSRLDTLLGGGYLRGSSVLVTGLPGTAKTTLAAAFATAAVRRRERTLMFLFDEEAAHVQRNLESVGYDLAGAVRGGLLHMESLLASQASVESHFVNMLEQVDQLKPRCVVVDPVSALLKASEQNIARSVAERLIEQLRARGITTMLTSLMLRDHPIEESSPMSVSTIADTWMHLTYAIRSGERNRALSIIKSRGTRHSNQVRELLLDATGVHLADVYTQGGEALLGTARLERESELRAQEQERQRTHEEEMRKLRVSIEHDMERLQSLQREIHGQRETLARLSQDDRSRKSERARQTLAIGRARFADHDSPKKRRPTRLEA